MAANFRFCFLLLLPALLLAADDSAAIRALLDKQVADWNRGDIPAFVQTYAEQCTFVGKTVVEGRAAVEARYHHAYPNAAAMGHLTFGDLKIKQLDSGVAIVTGAYHLAREASAGGDAHGIFSLVLEREGHNWHIILDHTTSQ